MKDGLTPGLITTASPKMRCTASATSALVGGGSFSFGGVGVGAGGGVTGIGFSTRGLFVLSCFWQPVGRNKTNAQSAPTNSSDFRLVIEALYHSFRWTVRFHPA